MRGESSYSPRTRASAAALLSRLLLLAGGEDGLVAVPIRRRTCDADVARLADVRLAASGQGQLVRHRDVLAALVDPDALCPVEHQRVDHEVISRAEFRAHVERMRLDRRHLFLEGVQDAGDLETQLHRARRVARHRARRDHVVGHVHAPQLRVTRVDRVVLAIVARGRGLRLERAPLACLA